MAHLKVIKKADRQSRTADTKQADGLKPSRVSDWITETRIAREAQRMRDLKAFFGTVTA